MDGHFDTNQARGITSVQAVLEGRCARPGITTTVKFVIDRDGKIHDIVTETESGNGTFDRAALRAVTESSPLPPLPFGYAGTYLNVHLTFK